MDKKGYGEYLFIKTKAVERVNKEIKNITTEKGTPMFRNQ